MQKRTLGRTGEQVSIIGFGGIALMNTDSETAERLVRHAIEAGINYFDIAPAYGDSIDLLGPALEPYRDDIFLACKTAHRMKGLADEQLKESLEIMRTKHFDLYQIHAIDNMEDVETVCSPGGALETLIEAREKGLVKYLGFSAHCEEAAVELADRFDFDTVMLGINWPCWQNGFGRAIAKKAVEKNMALVAIKTFAKRKWKDKDESKRAPSCWYCPVETYEEALLGLRFTLSHGVSVALTAGCEEVFDWACKAAQEFTPIEDDELNELIAKTEDFEAIFPQKKK